MGKPYHLLLPEDIRKELQEQDIANRIAGQPVPKSRMLFRWIRLGIAHDKSLPEAWQKDPSRFK